MRSRFGGPTEHKMSIDHRENASGRRYHTIYRSILWNDMSIYLYMSVIWPIKMYSCLIFIISKRNCDASRAKLGRCNVYLRHMPTKIQIFAWMLVLNHRFFFYFRFLRSDSLFFVFNSNHTLTIIFTLAQIVYVCVCVCGESFALSSFRFACFVPFHTTEWTSFYVR